jgi:hypothetical protein
MRATPLPMARMTRIANNTLLQLVTADLVDKRPTSNHPPLDMVNKTPSRPPHTAAALDMVELTIPRLPLDMVDERMMTTRLLMEAAISTQAPDVTIMRLHPTAATNIRALDEMTINLRLMEATNSPAHAMMIMRLRLMEETSTQALGATTTRPPRMEEVTRIPAHVVTIMRLLHMEEVTPMAAHAVMTTRLLHMEEVTPMAAHAVMTTRPPHMEESPITVHPAVMTMRIAPTLAAILTVLQDGMTITRNPLTHPARMTMTTLTLAVTLMALRAARMMMMRIIKRALTVNVEADTDKVRRVAGMVAAADTRCLTPSVVLIK